MKKINVLDVCKVTSTTPVLRSAPLWNKRPENARYTTVFIDTISGRFLDCNDAYVDTEKIEDITFPDLKINVRAISDQAPTWNGRATDHRGILYARDFSRNDFSKVSPSLKIVSDEYDLAFKTEIEKNEQGANNEQGAVVVFNNETMPDGIRNTISAVYLPDTINRVTAQKATTESFAALLFTFDYLNTTFLLPNTRIDDPKFQNILTSLGVSSENFIVPPVPFDKGSIWDLALFVYQIRHPDLYRIEYDVNYRSQAENYHKAFQIFARLRGASVISISHTHPGLKPQYDFQNHFVQKDETYFHTNLSEGDEKLMKENELPDLIIIFKNDGNNFQRVEKIVVLWSTARDFTDVAPVCYTKEQFFSMRSRILYSFLIKHYPPPHN